MRKFITGSYTKNKNSSFSGWNITAEGYTQAQLIEALGIKTEYDEETSNYRISGKIGAGIKGIKISPETFILPQSLSVSPEMSLIGVSCTSSIVIQFNKKVNLSDFVDSSTNSIKNIKIESNKQNYLDTSNGKKSYFNLPVLSEDGKTMMISTNKSQRILSNEEYSSYVDLNVTLLTGPQYDASGKLIRAALQDAEDNKAFDKDISWTYRVNSTTAVSPQILTLNAAKSLDFVNDSLPATGKDTWTTDADYKKAHLKDTVYFTGSFTTSNGLDKLKIVETLEEKVDGQKPGTVKGPYYISLSAISEIGENVYSINTPLEYKLNTIDDGLIKLEVSFIDISGMECVSKKTYFVIKDTTVNKFVVHGYTKLPFDDSTLYRNSIEYMHFNKNDGIYSVKLNQKTNCTLKDIKDNKYRIYWKNENANNTWFQNHNDEPSCNSFFVRWGNSKDYTQSSELHQENSILFDSVNNEFSYLLPMLMLIKRM